MPRRIVRHEPHDFSDLPDLVFQTLIRDLLSVTYPNRRVVEYGGQGSQQYGIDVLVGHKDHAVFAQVKRTSRLEPGAVRKLANDFLIHLDGHWQGWTLEAFIVAVSSKILKPQTHQALETFRKQLDLQGIPLIIWDSPVIRDLAWGKHTVFERYLDSEELIEQLCGPHVPHGGLELTVSIALGLERAYRRWAADPRTMVVAFLDDVLPHSELEAVELSRFILALRDHPIERNRIFAGRHEGDLEQGFAALASTSGISRNEITKGVVAVRRTFTAWGETPPLDENEREWARLLRLSEQGWIRMHIGQGTRQVEILKPLVGKFHSLEPGRSHSDLLEPLMARGENVRLKLGQQVSLTLDAGETSADLEALFGDGEIELSEVPQQSEQRVRMCCGDTTVLLVGHLEYFRLRQMLVLRFSSPGGTVFLEWDLPTNLNGAQLKFWTLPIAQRSDLRPEDKPYLRALGMLAHSSAVRLEWTPTGRGSIKLKLEDFEVPGHLQVYNLLADSLEVEQILLERSWIEQDLEFPDLDDVAALMRWSVTLRQLNIFLKGEPAGVWTVDMEVPYLREGLTRDRWGHTTAPFRTIDVLHDASGHPWLLRTLDWAGGRVQFRRVGDTEYLPYHFVPCEDDFPLELRLEGEAKLTFAPLNEDMGSISTTSTF